MKVNPVNKEPLYRLFSYLPPYKGYIFLALIAMVIAAATSSLMALLMGKLTDLGFYQKNGLVAIWAPIALIGISVLHGGGQFCSSYLLQMVSQKVLVQIRGLMFDNMIRWPEETVQQEQSGRVVSRFVNEASQALSSASEVLTVLVRDSLQVIALMCVLLWHNWQLTAVTLVVAPFLVVILRTVSKKLKKLTSDSQVTFGAMLNVLGETYKSERLIKVYDAYKFEAERFGHVNRRLQGLTMRQQVVKGLGTPLTQLVSMCGVSVVVFVALVQAQHGTLSLSEFVTYISAMLLMMPAIRKLANLNGTIARMAAAAESLFQMIDVPLEKDPGTKTLGRAKGKVEFRNVCYKYPQALEPSLKDFSLKVEAGSMVALVGASGAGKSTIINMIPRFMIPASGEILMDDIPQNELTLASIREQIAIVTQEVMLFDDTIAANIAFGAGREVSEEEIMKAAEAAYLLPLIQSLPEGINTRIGESGAKLSGGQRQRVSIARALLKNAPILLLDEATSALDTESEKYIQASLDKLRSGRTSFVVAHRLSTIVDADCIVVLDQGAIVETGTHFELLQKDGPYAHLYKIQFSKQVDKHHSEGK
ncbi:lipid A export permease/ATP-binding protein MsbA [Parasutterella muris]|uniref:lipid A export permease/ATP-binding protein MsbA n=1 Tax=Parasutterella muris TaxID=2565572 RepID=UPI00203EE560|nr:lipid A export permease/ATP-binding protein MsbA [Parasutterella muris]